MSQLSRMSSYQSGVQSQFQSSVASSISDAEPPEDESFRIIFAITAICVFLGLIGFVGFMLLGSAEVEEAEAADIFSGGIGGGGGGGGGGSHSPPAGTTTTPRASTAIISTPGSSTPVQPPSDTPVPITPPSVRPTPVVSPTPTTTSTRTTRSTTPSTTTPMPFSVDELVCTVGASAVFKEMNPPDGLCHYIYYASVAVIKSQLIAVETSVSWVSFKTSLSTYTQTSGGIGFDVRYSPKTEMNSSTQDELKNLANKNIKHYGVLNVLDIPSKVQKRFNDAKELLSTLKGFQEGDATRKTLLAIGILNYKHANAMSILRDMFQDAVNQHVADTVIVYSSVGWIESKEECYSHPPSVFDKAVYRDKAAVEADRAPDIKSISRLMTKDKPFTSDAKMGLSLELGTLIYWLRDPASIFDAVNQHCKSLYVTNMDVAPCRINIYGSRNELFDGVNVGEIRNDKLKVLLFDDDLTITKKCNDMAKNSTFLRHGMSLLLVNAHLGDFSGDNSQCKGEGETDREDPFWRIKVVKNVLKIP